jgi:hypothetical protein
MICREEETVPRARMRSSMKAVQMLEYLKQLSTVRWVYSTQHSAQCTVGGFNVSNLLGIKRRIVVVQAEVPNSSQ